MFVLLRSLFPVPSCFPDFCSPALLCAAAPHSVASKVHQEWDSGAQVLIGYLYPSGMEIVEFSESHSACWVGGGSMRRKLFLSLCF